MFFHSSPFHPRQSPLSNPSKLAISKPAREHTVESWPATLSSCDVARWLDEFGDYTTKIGEHHLMSYDTITLPQPVICPIIVSQNFQWMFYRLYMDYTSHNLSMGKDFHGMDFPYGSPNNPKKKPIHWHNQPFYIISFLGRSPIS